MSYQEIKILHIGAPWIGDNTKVLERISADMLGKPYTNNNITYNSSNSSTFKIHKLKDFEDRKFIEKFVSITTSGETITDEEDSLETIKGNEKLEIIYILI